MRNVFIVAIAALTLAGCGRIDRWVAGTTGQPTKTCVDGVTFLQFTSGAVRHSDLNGKPVPCN